MNMRINWGRWLVIVTLLIGIGLHLTRLIVGSDAFQPLFTATLDAIFTIPIVLGIIGMVRTWRFIQFRGRFEKGVAIFTLAYFVVSMPLHFQTWFTGNTDYITAFPWWYSLVFISYSSLLLFVWSRLRIQDNVRP